MRSDAVCLESAHSDPVPVNVENEENIPGEERKRIPREATPAMVVERLIFSKFPTRKTFRLLPCTAEVRSNPTHSHHTTESIMSRFLSSFWTQKPQPGRIENDGDAKGSSTADGATGAASWITMKDPSAGERGEPVMVVNQATVKGVLEPLGDKEAVNLVAIFGAARGGKSFLMNQLAGQDDIFKISNDKARCCCSREREGTMQQSVEPFACCVCCLLRRILRVWL